MPRQRKGTLPPFDVEDPRARRTLWARHQLLLVRYQKFSLFVQVIRELVDVMARYESELEDDLTQLHIDSDDLLEFETRRDQAAE